MSNANEKRSLPRHALRWLQTEIDFWLANNHIDAETASRLRALYAESPDASTSEKAPSPDFPRSAPRDFGQILVFATATLGALALGIALYFVFAQIWTDLANSAKIAILLGSLALSYVGAFAARTFKRPNFSAALFFLGAFVFGLSVWQFAEVFRFEIKFPTAYWLWGLAAFGVAFFGDRAATHYLAVGILAVWTVGEIALDEPTAFSPTRFCDFLPGGAYSLPIFAALGWRWGVRRGASGVSLLYALLGVFWASLQPPVWLDGSRFPDFIYPFYFIFLGGFVYFVGAKIVRDPFVAAKLRFLGGATVFVLLSIATRRALYEHDFSDYDGCRASSLFATPEFWGSLVFFAVFGAVALTAFLGALRRRRDLFATRSDRRAVLVSPTGIALLLIPTFLLALFGPTPEDADVSLLATLAAVWANVVAVGAAVVCFLVGAFRSARLYWFGVSYFLIWLTFRYFSFDIDDAGTAALFFGIVAISLFGAALFLSRLRKKLDAANESTDSSDSLEPPLVAFLAAAFDAPQADAAPRPAFPEPTANARRRSTCALALVVVSQFAALGAIVVEARRPFVPVESFVVEASVRRSFYYRSDLDPFGRARGEYVGVDYVFEELQPPKINEDLNDYRPPHYDESIQIVRDENLKRGVRTVYAVLKRDEETGVSRPIRLTATRPTSLGDGETLLVGRRESRWRATYPGVQTFPLSAELDAQFDALVDKSYTGVCDARVKIEKSANGSARVVDVELLPPEPAEAPPAWSGSAESQAD